MEYREYIESKLSNLTDEFKKSKIVGEDGKEYTFEDYLNTYVLDNMRSDYTFGHDDFVDNVDTLIMLQQSETGLNAREIIEMPKINKANIEKTIYDYVDEKGYTNYLNQFMEYPNAIVGTLKSMIDEFIIPNIDDYGKVIESGHEYSYQEFIDKKIEDQRQKKDNDLVSKKNNKIDSLNDNYYDILDYPVNDLDSSLTIFRLLISEVVNNMDESNKISYKGNLINIEKLLESKSTEAKKLNDEFIRQCKSIEQANLSTGRLNEYIRIASVVNPLVPEDSIINKLLNSMLANIMNGLNSEEKESVVNTINNANIKNDAIKNVAQTYVSNTVYEPTDSKTVRLYKLKNILNEKEKEYELQEDFDVYTSSKIYEEFTKLLEEFTELVTITGKIDEYRVFIERMENTQKSMKIRYTFEEEKQDIISSYKKLQANLEEDESKNRNLNDYVYFFNEIKTQIEELLEFSAKKIKISRKDRDMFDTMIETANNFKREMSNLDYSSSLRSIL
jgi:hypothetical protein